MKKIKMTALVLAIIVSFALISACSNANPGIPDIVATVNGEPITAHDIEDALVKTAFSSEISLEEITALPEEDLQTVYGNMLESCITNEVLLQNARQAGLDTRSEEQESEIKTQVDSFFEQLKASYATSAENGISLNSEVAASREYNNYVKKYNLTEKFVTDDFRTTAIINNLYSSVMSNFALTEEQVGAYYNELLTTQQTLDAENPDTAFENYAGNTNEVNVYIPGKAETDARYIKHILFAIPEETQAEIDALNEAGRTEEAAALEEQSLADTKAEADAIYNELSGGADFDELMYEHTSDSGSLYYPDGYLVYEGASYVPEFIEAAMALQNPGDMSQPVQSSYGYHILQYASQPVSGPIPMDTILTELEYAAQSKYSSEYWQQQLDQMLAEAAIERFAFQNASSATPDEEETHFEGDGHDH